MKFPKVMLLKNIRLKEKPLGRYLPGKRQIELSLTAFKEREPDDQRFTVYHELGHWWRCEMVPEMPNNQEEQEFADAFAYYFVSPGTLDPRARSYFKSSLADEKGISEFAEEICKRLKELL